MAQIYCAHCGKINEDTSKFCAHCGAAMVRPQAKMEGFGEFGEMFSEFFGKPAQAPQGAVKQTVRQETPFGTVQHTVYVQPKVENDPELDKKIKKFKRKRTGGRKFRMICVPVAIVSALLANLPLPYVMMVFAPVYIVSVFPAVVGVIDCIRWLCGNRGDRSVERLEELGLLPLLLHEMEHGKKVPFGDKAWMSDHFIFGRKGKGVIVAMDDVLWVYTTYFKHHYTLKVGTRTMGEKQIFGTGIPARFNKGYKQQLLQIGAELEKRNPNVLIDYSAENRAKYEAMRQK